MPSLIQLVQGTEHETFKFDWPVTGDDHQIKFDWPVRLANGYRDPHLLPTAMIRYMVVVLARPICGPVRLASSTGDDRRDPCGVLARPILADIESGTRENEVITPWSQMPNLIQLVQATGQALPLYDPIHRDSLPPHERCPVWRPIP